jgi:septum formation inhibitor MinC
VDAVIQNTWSQMQTMTSNDRLTVVNALQQLHEQEAMEFDEKVNSQTEQYQHGSKDVAVDLEENEQAQPKQIPEVNTEDYVTAERQMALEQVGRQLESGDENHATVLLHSSVETVQHGQPGLEHFIGKQSMIFVSCYFFE